MIWLQASVVSLSDRLVPGYVIKERRVEDEDKAKKLNKLTRITALLAKAVDDAFSYSDNVDPFKETSASNENPIAYVSPDVADDVKLLQTMLENDGGRITSDIQNLIKAIGGQLSGESSGATSDCEDTDDKEHKEETPIKQRSGDAAPSVLELISNGPSADISKIHLTPEETKLVASVVSGELSVQKLANLIIDTRHQLTDANQILNKLMIPLRNKKPKNPAQRRLSGSNGSLKFAAKQFLKRSSRDVTAKKSESIPLHKGLDPISIPPLVSLNLSYSMIGNSGLDVLSGCLISSTPKLRCLDISFCQVHERGFLALARALVKRRKKGIMSLQGLILTGNVISYRAAKDLGTALCHKPNRSRTRLSYRHDILREGYHEDYEEDGSFGEEDEEDLDDSQIGGGKRRYSGKSDQRPKKEKVVHNETKTKVQDDPGIQLIRLASTSLNASSLRQMLLGLGESSRIREIDVSSNGFGAEGITPLADFLEGRGQQVMPELDRLNISNNNIDDDGLAKITRAISKRRQTSIVDIHLSFNEIGSGGTGTLMNKLLSQNVVTLSLDNNLLGDAGCQLVAASLTSMHHLSSLNLSFNQIGSRGVTTLMRALIGCESLTFLGLSGNVMKISGAIAMGFALAQHPRISHLQLYNCCLSQVAQCHIVAGIISNRWVPLQVLNGFCVGPPMAAIGALDPVGQHLGNTECFTIRRNVQMKAMLEWFQASKNKGGIDSCQSTQTNYNDFQSLDFVSPDQSDNGAPSQNAFMRMLEWLSRIPFDEEELNTLRQYFYDADDGSPDGLRGSDGKINLKYRGDLLAALGSGMMKEMRDDENNIVYPDDADVGLWIDESNNELKKPEEEEEEKKPSQLPEYKRNNFSSSKNSISSKNSTSINGSTSSLQSQQSRDSKSSKCKARITMFPKFFEKLDLLKLNAQEMMNNELDPVNQDLIAQQFAEASLILLRQLRYQCMSSGLDGWRHGKTRRKVLIVDDSKVTRKLVGRAFEKANFIVDTAENGEEGVRMLKESVYDIAFMDIDMPVMNGFDATKALREWEDSKRPGARQPICALTATYVDDFEVHELMKFKEAGLDVMESKPCNIPRLFKVVDDVSPLFSDLSISVTKQHSNASLKELEKNV